MVYYAIVPDYTDNRNLGLIMVMVMTLHLHTSYLHTHFILNYHPYLFRPRIGILGLNTKEIPALV